MRRFMLLAALLVLAFLLAACAPGVSSGRVIAKQYNPSHYAETYIPRYHTVCHSSGSCQTYDDGYWANEYVPASYQIELAQGSVKNLRTGWVDVDKTTWDRTHTGQRYP